MNYECKKGMGTASVSLAVLAVPPSTSSPKERSEARRETPRITTGTVALPVISVKPMLWNLLTFNFMQIHKYEQFAQ